MEKIRNLQPQIESIIKKRIYNFGVQQIELSTDRGLSVNLYLNNFRGNPKQLSEMIKEQLIRNLPELRGTNFRVWVESWRR